MTVQFVSRPSTIARPFIFRTVNFHPFEPSTLNQTPSKNENPSSKAEYCSLWVANFLVDFAHTCSIRWSVPKSIFINENWIKGLSLDRVKRASFFSDLNQCSQKMPIFDLISCVSMLVHSWSNRAENYLTSCLCLLKICLEFTKIYL